MYEPFANNYVWNLSVNIAMMMGAEIGEIVEANAPVIEAAKQGADAGTEAFFNSWCSLANRLIRHAERDVALGRAFSAGESYRRACIYLMIAERMQRRGYAPRDEAYAKMLETMGLAVKYGEYNVARVEIPYEGGSYPGLFMKATSKDGRLAPCMVHTNGLDSIKEMIYWSGIGDALARRGISTLMIDHPGVGEALRLRSMPGVHDSERWGTAALEYLQGRDDVDPARIGIMGWSLGGYYAPRAAAFEPRFALCVSWGANHFWGELQERRLRREGENPVPHYWDHVMWVFGQPDMESFMRFAKNMTLDGVVSRIRVPYLVTHGENDRQIPLEAAHRSYDQAVNSPKRELRIFTREDGGVEHVSADNATPSENFIADWIAETFA